MEKIIAHLDLDAFFASVEERYNPQWKGMPIVVGSDPKKGTGRGVVSTANYKAREYGIHSAMPITRAWEASQQAKREGKPEAIFLPVDFELYHKTSRAVLEIIQKYSDTVEQASVDEFYFILQGTYPQAERVCKKIKKEIVAQEKVTCSIGIAPNRFLSKIAAGFKKPDGLFIALPSRSSKERRRVRPEHVIPGTIEEWLEPMPIKTLSGVGPKTAELLAKNNIFTVGDAKKLSQTALQELLGKWGLDLYQRVRGVGSSEIVTDREVKSIGEQNTFEQDSSDLLFITEELKKYAKSVFATFTESGFTTFRTIAVTVRFADFTTQSASKTLRKPVGVTDFETFQIEVIRLLLPFLDKRKNPHQKRIRLIGVRIEQLGHTLPLL